MKVVQLNATCGIGSTGKICIGINKLLNDEKIENYILYTAGHSDCKQGIKYANTPYIKLQALKSRIFANYGFNSMHSTRTLIKELERIKPDIVHIHNIHGHDCKLQMLFSYLRKTEIKIIWTFHDCWAFTAYCPYFDYVNCKKWKTGCGKCPQYRKFSFFADRSKKIFEKKKALFLNQNITVVTPSKWLADLTKQSFFKDYPINVINNGIDLSVFKPRQSDFRKKYDCENKFIILGVAFDWGERKGLDAFSELAKSLDDRFRIVLVGVGEKNKGQLPDNVITISRTQNQIELAEIYTAADLFVNPTREENYPTVNMESIACGTPVLTFDTGGSSEMLSGACGISLPRNDINGLEKEIRRIEAERPFKELECLKQAENFDMTVRFKEYVQLYKRVAKE